MDNNLKRKVCWDQVFESMSLNKSEMGKIPKHTQSAPLKGTCTKQKPQKNEQKTLYCIGTADPATGDDESFYFTKQQLEKIVRDDVLIGIKIWFEHGDNTKQEIGKVIHCWVDQESGLMIVMELFNNILFAKVISKYIENGLLTGISLGYDAKLQKKDNITKVVSKTINEISIVMKPHHTNCRIGFTQYET